MTQTKPIYAKIKALPLYVVSAMLGAVVTEITHAEQIFNTAFLTDGLSNTKISDLSKLQNSTQQLPGVYRVEIYANDQYISSRDVKFIEKTGTQDPTGLMPCIDIKTLEKIGVNIAAYPDLLTAKDQQCLDLALLIEGADTLFQFDKQKLKISLPQIALKDQVRGYIPPEQWDDGINAMFLNYRMSGYNNSGSGYNSKGFYTSVDSGLNLGSWQLRHSGALNYTSADGGRSEHEWISLNTYLQKTLIPIKSQIRIGDGSSDNSIFDSYAYRGVELSTADSMYPESQQGYAPNVRGVAKTNAKVVIRQNNNIVYQVNVAPGPFLIQDLNPAFGSGDLQVSIEESDGSTQSYIVPYSGLPILQREGRTRYSVMVGEFRNGIRSNDRPTVVQATAVHGLKKGLSIYAGSQLSDDYKSALLGFGSNMGRFGAFSFDFTHANSQLVDDSRHSGQSMRFLYSKSLLGSGTTFQLLGYRYSTRGFYTLNDVAYGQMDANYVQGETQDGNMAWLPIISNGYDLKHVKKGRLQANISHSMGKYGSLYLSGNQQTYWDTNKADEWLQMGYNATWKGISYSLAVNRNMFSQLDQANTIYTANFSFPLDKLRPKANLSDSLVGSTYATVSTTQNSDGNNSYLTGINGTLLKGRNLSYSIRQGYVTDQGSAGSIAANYNGTYGNVGAGYSYDSDTHRVTYNASGGMLLHRDGVTFGQSLGDTSILVKAPGAKGVKIENYNGVRTDWRGYAILPYASEYRLNRVALDSNSFGSNLEIGSNVSSVVPIRGAISRATFDTSIGVRALINISFKGQAIPYASSVTEISGKASGMSAEEGIAYMTGLPLKGQLNVVWGDATDQKCVADYDISTADLTQPIQQFNLECK